jgi:hypothetical protein
MTVLLVASCQVAERPKTHSVPRIASVLQASVGKISLNMSKPEVLKEKGPPVSEMPVRESNMENWEYENVTVLFEAGNVAQVVGSEGLSIGSETFPVGLTLSELARRLPLDESKLLRPKSGPRDWSIPLQDGKLTVGHSRGKVLTYGLQLSGIGQE